MNANFIKNFALAGRKVAGVVGRNLKEASPEILLVVGVAGVVVSTVMACRATKHVDDILDEHNAEREALENEDEIGTSEDENRLEIEENTDISEHSGVDSKAPAVAYKRALWRTYCKTGWRFVKLYGPSVALGAASMACIFASHGILRKRNAGLLAAYTMMERGFSEYRNRVRDILGEEEEEKLRLGIHEEEFEETITDEDGAETTVLKKGPIFDLSSCSQYARYYDAYSVYGWEGDTYQEMVLDGVERYANDRLIANDVVFLNEVYKDLDLPLSSDGQLAGWCKGGNGDGQIMIKRIKGYRKVSLDGMERVIPTTILDFNVDGDVHRCLDLQNRLGAAVRKRLVK